MAPKPRSQKTTPKTSSLLNALTFISAVTKKDGAPFETHVHISNKWATAFNGIVSAGHKIEEEIEACPHSDLSIEALSKCEETFSITQLENNRISIKSGKFRAIVPCVDSELMHVIQPDAPITTIDDRFKIGLEIVGILASEKSQNVITASILMNGRSLIATDRKVVMEYWHGNDLPPGLTIPKAFVGPFSKTKKKLAQFGFSQSSATFYFDDGSWIKTQIYADPWPDISRILDREFNPWSVPDDFFEALSKIEYASEDGNVYFDENLLRSHPYAEKGASYEVKGIPKGVIYPAEYLKMLKGLATKIDFAAPGVHNNSYCLYFIGDNCRGVIAGRER